MQIFQISGLTITLVHITIKTGRSAREAMENTLEICRHFVDSFGTEFHNLFLYGDVGVGKTYLSTCIAKEIINREFSVIYFSAPQLFNTLAQNTFDKKDVDARNMSEYIFECDLLIIDDLGTEYTNSFIASQFLPVSMKDCYTGNQRSSQQTFLWNLLRICIQNALFPGLQAVTVC